MTTRSVFRERAERTVKRLVANAWRHNWSAKELRRRLRAAFERLMYEDAFVGGASTFSRRSTWLRAVRSVTGFGVLGLSDPRQMALQIDVGTSSPKPRNRTKRSNAR